MRKRKTIRLENADYSSTGMFFLTICTKERRCILSHIVGTGVLDGPEIELTRYGKIADKYIKQINDFYEHISVEHYVIMPNHIHLLLFIKPNGKGPSGTPVPTIQNSTVSQFVSTFKRFCNKDAGESIWQYRSYDHIIRNHEDYVEHVRYIYDNPIRWRFDKLYAEEL